MSYFAACPSCAGDRKHENFERALECEDCKGTGVITRERDSYLCNRCGETLCCGSHWEGPFGLVDAKVSGGYESAHLTDLTTYTFSVCEKCLRDLFGSFKIPPRLGTAVSMEEETYEEDVAHYKVWGWNRNYAARLEKRKKGLCDKTEECVAPGKWLAFQDGHLCDELLCDEHRYGGESWSHVPKEELEGIPSDYEKRTPEENRKVAESWLLSVKKREECVFYRFLPDCLSIWLNTDIQDDCLSGLWSPSPLTTELLKEPVAGGVLYWGSTEEIIALAGSQSLHVRPDKPRYQELLPRVEG